MNVNCKCLDRWLISKSTQKIAVLQLLKISVVIFLFCLCGGSVTLPSQKVLKMKKKLYIYTVYTTDGILLYFTRGSASRCHRPQTELEVLTKWVMFAKTTLPFMPCHRHHQTRPLPLFPDDVINGAPCA